MSNRAREAVVAVGAGSVLPLAAIMALGVSQAGYAEEPPSAWDRTWAHARLYEGEGFVRYFDLSGRLHADAAYFDGEDESYSETLWRRFRFGFKMGLPNGWLAHLEGSYDLEEFPDDTYSGLTDAYVGRDFDDGTKLRILKHSAGFTLDGATSSKKLLTPQRNNVTRNLWFTAEYFTGVSLAGKFGDGWSYKAGLYSGDGNDEWSKFDAGNFALGSLGYDFAGGLGLDKALVRLDYVYNEEDTENNTPDFSRVVSLSSDWEQGAWGLRAELASGDGYYEQSDLWGVVLMPYYDLTDRWQLVLRYTYLDSDDLNGIRFGRYEDRVVEGRGDEYDEYFAGINYFFYGHKFKWQTGVQYTTMKDSADDGGDFDGWGITTVLRLYW